MKAGFNVGQVLQIAERIQNNGAKFYLKMADMFGDAVRRGLCLELACWRARQERALAEKKERFYESCGKLGTMASGDYIMSNPSVMANLAVFANKLYVAGALTGRESRAEILKDAIARAEEAVAFYRGLGDFSGNQVAEGILGSIIKDESAHVSLLTESLQANGVPALSGRHNSTWLGQK